MGIKELSIEEKIGQMIIIGMDTNYITDRIKTMIKKNLYLYHYRELQREHRGSVTTTQFKKVL